MEKIFNQKNFINFVWSPLGSRGVCSLILFPLFATCVNDTGGKFAAGVFDTGGNLPPASLTPQANLPPVSLTPVANLPPVSTTQRELVAKFAVSVTTLAANFAAGVVETGGNLPPVVHLDLRISPRIFEKMILMLLSGAWGKVIHEKNLKQKIS
jgi:hypothetical protein